MKKLLHFVFVLSFMGCSNESTEIENYIDDNSNITLIPQHYNLIFFIST